MDGTKWQDGGRRDVLSDLRWPSESRRRRSTRRSPGQTVKGLPDLKPCKPGKYADGLPFNEIQYLECKLILQPESLHVAQEPVRLRQGHAPAGRSRARSSSPPSEFVNCAAADSRGALPRHRGLPVLQQRLHPAATHPLRGRLPAGRSRRSCSSSATRTCRRPPRRDVRPQIFGDYRIKFKAEALPLKDQLGGIRLLFSHNVEFR